MVDPTPEHLLRAFDGVAVEGVPLTQAEPGAGLFCVARFLPMPASLGTGSLARDLPDLTACLDFTRAGTLLRAHSAARFETRLRERFAVVGDASPRWFGWITLGAPTSVELCTPNGVGIVPDDAWPRGARHADLLVGMDLLGQGALVFVGDQCGLVPRESIQPGGGRFWFTRPRW